VWAVSTSQETNYVSAAEPNRLMLFGETVAVGCENQTKHTDTLFSPYLTGNTIRPRYRAEPVNAAGENRSCLLWEPYGTHRYIVQAVRTSQETHYLTTTEPKRLMLFGATVAVYCEKRVIH
jgi:hypothetical protein